LAKPTLLNTVLRLHGKSEVYYNVYNNSVYWYVPT